MWGDIDGGLPLAVAPAFSDTVRLRPAGAEDAAELLEIDYEPLPAVTSTADAVAQAKRLLRARGSLDWRSFTKIIGAIQMQTNTEWYKKYYNEEAQKLLAERRHLWSPELQQKSSDDWAELFKDIEAAATKGLKPGGVAGMAIAERHSKLIEAFTGGNASIGEALGKLWADRDN